MKNIITVLLAGATLYSCNKPENKVSENKATEQEIKTVDAPEPAETSDQEVKESPEENKKKQLSFQLFRFSRLLKAISL